MTYTFVYSLEHTEIQRRIKKNRNLKLARMRVKRKIGIPGKDKAMISEEKLIGRWKNRKLRIIPMCILIGVFSGLTVFWNYAIERSTGALEVVAGRYGPSVTMENLGEHLTESLTTCSDLTFIASKALVSFAISAAALVFMIALFIVELTGYGYQRIIVSMWERIERLEKGAQEQIQEKV